MLHVVHGFPPECRGGTESLVRAVALAQSQREIEVAILTGTLAVADAAKVEKTTIDSLLIYRLTKGGYDIDRWDRSDDVAAAVEIDRVLEDFAPSVVHIHHWIRLSRLLVRTARARGIPVVLALHDATATCPTAFRMRAGSLCDRSPSGKSCADCAPTPSHLEGDQLSLALDHYAEELQQEVAAADAVTVPTRAHARFIGPWLPPGVTPVVISNPPLTVIPKRKQEPVSTHGPLRVVAFGQLSVAKGTPLLYAALRCLSPFDRANLTLTVKGSAIDAPTRAILDELKEGMPIVETGAYTPDTLDGNEFDVAVLPSVTSESWSFALDESWAMGLPAIVPDRGALSERVGEAGFKFLPEDPQALAKVISRLIANRSLLHAAQSLIPPPSQMEVHLETLDGLYARVSEVSKDPEELWRGVASDLAERLRGVEQTLAQASGRLEGERVRFDDLQRAFTRAEGSVSTLRDEVSDLMDSLAHHERSLRDLRLDREALQAELHAVASHRETLVDALRQRDVSLVEFERSVAEYRDIVRKKESDLASFQVSIENHQRELRLRNEAAEVAERHVLTSHEAMGRALADVNSELSQTARRLQRQGDALTKELGWSESHQRGSDDAAAERRPALQLDSIAAAFEASGHANELEALHTHLDALAKSAAMHDAVIVNLRELIATTVERESGLTARLAALALRLATADGEVRILDDRVRELLRARRIADGVIEHLTADLTNLRRSLAEERLTQGTLRRELEGLRTTAHELAVSRDRAMAQLKRSEHANRESLARCAELVELATGTSQRLRAATLGLAREQSAAESWRRRAQLAESAVSERAEVIEDLQRRTVALRDELESTRQALLERRADQTRVASLLGASSDEATELSKVAEDLRSDLDRLRTTLAEVTSALTSAQIDLPRARRALAVGENRLRVLIVVHDFLPYHAAGSEVYTYQLAKALRAHCDVHLVFCENRPDRPQYETRDGVFDGIPFTEVVHHDAFPTFGLTYEDPAMERVFDGLLKRIQPSIVHIQHLKFWGIGIVNRAVERACPVFFTLHEYMLICPRDGQMRRPNGERCDIPVVSTCAACIEGKALEQGWIAQRALAAGRFLSERLPDGARHVGARLARRVAMRRASEGSQGAREHAISLRLKRTGDALRHVEMFLAPSQFLRDRFIASGMIPADRIEWSRYGQDVLRFPTIDKVKSSRLRVGYLGTISSYKGLGVLIDALESLVAFEIEGRIHGALEIFPDYVEHLRRSLTNPRIHLLGRFDNKDVARLLAEIDVLVVPSLWWENAPLTIHEAFLAGVPVVCSDIGGMRELVTHGKNGLHFVAGDASDLARTLLGLATDPRRLAALRPDPTEIRDIREDATTMLARYRRVLAKQQEGRAQ